MLTKEWIVDGFFDKIHGKKYKENQELWKDDRMKRYICFLYLIIMSCGQDVSNIPKDVWDQDIWTDAIEIVDFGSKDYWEDETILDVESKEEVSQISCIEHSDCPSGWCAWTKDGKICAVECGNGCKDGFVCRDIGGNKKVCLDPLGVACLPCKSDDECAFRFGVGGARCEDMDGYWFCLVKCFDGLCPGGYTCEKEREDKEGICKPVAGCSCDWEGVTGKCVSVNEFGICEGDFKCEGGDHSICSVVPKEEVCNGVDDNCNGVIDEGTDGKECLIKNEYGACVGQTKCEDGKSICDGKVPSPEVCNNEDDDCDGSVDEDLPKKHPDCPCGQCDKDEDGVIDPEDNCKDTFNPDQLDLDQDKIGDACDLDWDGDGIENDLDNCSKSANPDQTDIDKDGMGDACDMDKDGDGILNEKDNCPEDSNFGQEDMDGDGIGDNCDPDADGDKILDKMDNCPGVPNPVQEDLDKDGYGDVCDDDRDGDEVSNDVDNCPDMANPDQQDLDQDLIGDVCDADMDGDNILNSQDNCPNVANTDQQDLDKDGKGDKCDDDVDGDGVKNAIDNCLLIPNSLQTDIDKDGIGDACDDDKDGDGVPNEKDNCPGIPNPKQEDENKNGIGDLCEQDFDSDGIPNKDDNCPWVFNADQSDLDKDKIGDACDCDIDGDGIEQGGIGCAECNPCDSCPKIYNPEQEDFDQDGLGDECDGDDDGDGDLDKDDCDPKNSAVHHGADEKCNGIDDDCDGIIDPEGSFGCAIWFADNDGDGVGGVQNKCLCVPQAPYNVKISGDCDDKDPNINPNAKEICFNTKDDDCSGSQNDENALGCSAFWIDSDMDGFGGQESKCLCEAEGVFVAKNKSDCNDLDPNINPSAPEICGDNKDNNCNGVVDEEMCQGCIFYFKDADKDGFGVEGDKKCLGTPVAPYNATKIGDCNDNDPEINPDREEVCNGKDDNCDTITDPPYSKGCIELYPDLDKDGFGANVQSKCYCKPTGVYTAKISGDCNDNDANINPSKEETCNNVDDNCNDETDEEGAEGCKMFYLDQDGDGFGVADSKCLCKSTGLYKALISGDCDDQDKEVNPLAKEVCGNKKDDDCDSMVDEEGAIGCVIWYADADKDGFGKIEDKKCLCAKEGIYTTEKWGDCNDSDPESNPNAKEKCGGGDENCNGLVDEEDALGCVIHYLDADGDGYGIASMFKCLCAPYGKYSTTKKDDCDDTDNNINPGVKEICANGKDDNCNGVMDEEGAEGCNFFYYDNDGDGFGVDNNKKCLCSQSGKYNTTKGGDCDDTDGNIRPGAKETCNQKDDNCNGLIDDEPDVSSDPQNCGACGNVCPTSFLCISANCTINPFGSGKDGALTVTSGQTKEINTVRSQANGAMGSKVVSLASASGFKDGDIVLFHQTQGTGAGTWEYGYVIKVEGNNLTLYQPLTANYITSGNAKAQAIVVPQFTDVAISQGGVLTAPAWDGNSGGILVFMANGTVNVAGSINMNGKGYRGGNANICRELCRTGLQGESWLGNGKQSMDPNGSGGGGGAKGQDCASGGGGGYGGSGSKGSDGTCGTCIIACPNPGGQGGLEAGVANLSKTIMFGGGGGEGGYDEDGGHGGAGGNGGGIVMIQGKVINVTGSVASNGTNGVNGDQGCGGGWGCGMAGGGGGAGGAIRMVSDNVSLGNGLVQAGGGVGGICTCSSSYVGGNGGVGRISVKSSKINGTTSPPYYVE